MHQHYVLRLDVPMKDLMPMHESNRIEEVANDERGGLF